MKEVIDEVYTVWGSYGLPIYPALQGHAEAAEVEEARTYCISQYKSPGLSYWRYGVIGPLQFPVINQPMTQTQPPPPPDNTDEGRYGDEIIIKPGDPGYTTGKHNAAAQFKTFAGTWGWDVNYIETANDR